jgi:hypothetical protein
MEDKWISIEEFGMPDDMDDYLVRCPGFCESGYQIARIAYYGSIKWYNETGHLFSGTHYQPITPPKL